MIRKFKLYVVGLSVSSRVTVRKGFVGNKGMVQERGILLIVGLLGEIKLQRSKSLKSFLPWRQIT